MEQYNRDDIIENMRTRQFINQKMKLSIQKCIDENILNEKRIKELVEENKKLATTKSEEFNKLYELNSKLQENNDVLLLSYHKSVCSYIKLQKKYTYLMEQNKKHKNNIDSIKKKKQAD